MSKEEPKYDDLPKHQSKIVLCLAKEGPMIIRETNMRIKGEYTSTNRAFHELEAKGVIQRTSVRQYRKREFPRFWLTENGLAYAILHEANLNLLLENVRKAYPNDAEKALFVELATVHKDLFKAAFTIIQKSPNLDVPTALSLSTVTFVTSKKLSEKDVSLIFQRLRMVLSKYPKYYAALPKSLKKSEKQIRAFREQFQSMSLVDKEGVES